MQTLKCLFGLHKYEVYKEEPITDYKNEEEGKAIICKCTECGKIKTYYIQTKDVIM